MIVTFRHFSGLHNHKIRRRPGRLLRKSPVCAGHNSEEVWKNAYYPTAKRYFIVIAYPLQIRSIVLIYDCCVKTMLLSGWLMAL